jgi:hypothetical protein
MNNLKELEISMNLARSFKSVVIIKKSKQPWPRQNQPPIQCSRRRQMDLQVLCILTRSMMIWFTMLSWTIMDVNLQRRHQVGTVLLSHVMIVMIDQLQVSTIMATKIIN